MKSGSIPAITLWQPWAWLIAKGLKKFETRSWKTDYRGQILIHSAVKRPGLAERGYWNWWMEHGMLGTDPPELKSLPLGRIVAVADLAECCPTSGPNGWTPVEYSPEWQFGNWEPDRYGWKLRNVKALVKPVEATGLQRLWYPSGAIVMRVFNDLSRQGEAK